jgi:thioesterase domain-containing protein
MAAHYLIAMRKVQPKGPYLLGGYSAGGIIALEVAQQLKQQGEEVALLAVIDVPAQSPKYRYLSRLIHWLSALARIKPERERKLFLFFRDLIFRLEYFFRRGLSDFLKENLARAGRLVRPGNVERGELLRRNYTRIRGKVRGGREIPAGVQASTAVGRAGSEEEGDQAWQAYDRHMREHFVIVNEAVKCYIPQTYPGRVALFRSSVGYRRPEMRVADPHMGWGKIAADGLDFYIVPGNHLQIVREPSVKILGEQLKELLDRAHDGLPGKAPSAAASGQESKRLRTVEA